MTEIKKLVSQLTLEEKAGLCSGGDFWHTKAVERLGIPAAMVSDGPHGLRKQNQEGDHLGINDSIKAVCFPAGCGAAASFNRGLIRHMGEVLGNECQAEGVSTLLGPAVNIKRSPLGGRNFEYYSEDPYLAGEMASAFIGGVQSQNVGTSIKHFLANNQETRRMTVSSEVDERTLREIYLPPFETAVKEQKPWTVMCSYNRINGTYAAENKKYLTDILRNEWGFDGYVMSDWGAVNDRVNDLEAGLDLEMPSSGGVNDARIVEAVRTGRLKEEVLDEAVERILNKVFQYEEGRNKEAVFDRKKDHEEARKTAEETIVLLKNEGILPLVQGAKIAFIGKYAKEPRYQGGGSSHINSSQIDSALDAVSDLAGIIYAKGFDDREDCTDAELFAEAVKTAKEAEVAVIFAGLPDSFESEGYDRDHMQLPACQNELIHAVAAVQPNTVVVLHNGSPVEMPWIGEVKGVLEAYLGGEASGGAVADVLFGKVNPSGKLPETFPKRMEDNPSFLFYPGEGDVSEYREGIFVGYRYYDRRKMEVLFPFGHGLSYTTFAYSNLRCSKAEMDDEGTLTVSVDITNTGKVAGKEAVQLYIASPAGEVLRPEKELRGFEKVELQPGETKTVVFELKKRAFSYWETKIHDWYAPSGEYEILIGASSRDIRLSGKVKYTAKRRVPVHYTVNTCMGDIMENPEAVKALMENQKIAAVMKMMEERRHHIASGASETAKEAISEKMQKAQGHDMPLRGIISFVNGALSPADVEAIVKELNQKCGAEQTTE